MMSRRRHNLGMAVGALMLLWMRSLSKLQFSVVVVSHQPPIDDSPHDTAPRQARAGAHGRGGGWDRARYRMLVTQGCSGSTFAIATLHEILRAHGFVVGRGTSKFVPEVYHPEKNYMFARAKELAPAGASELDIVINATVMVHEVHLKDGKMSLFKWEPGIFNQFSDHVGRKNVLFGGVVRENVLDKLICHIRDCFKTRTPQPLGYPVFAANRSRTDLCFKRRTAGEGGRTKAHFPPEELGAVVKFLHKSEKTVAKDKKRFGSATAEELAAFEYTDDRRTVAASMEAWCALAGRFLVRGLDCGIIEDMLRPQIGSRSISYHEDVIDNYKQVFWRLRAAGLGGYIRSRDAA